jgi:hypothetical protein
MVWLTPLVEARLGEGFDALEPRLRGVIAEAHAEHLAARPHDRDGADVVAAFNGRDDGIRALSAVYLETLEWAVELLEARRPQRKRRWWRRRRAAGESAPVVCEVPKLVADEVTHPPARYGWQRRPAA